MKDTIKYVGLDVSKEKIAVSIAEEGRAFSMPPDLLQKVEELVEK
ncbi:hypothetical protein [Cytobacillus citreus]|nr:hypothetical protein [Cytobacillus citreus]